jgi:hypothetical protein
MSPEFKPYCISYQHQGASWGAEILAADHDDAVRRLRAIGTTGVVDGQLMATIPATVGFWVPLWCWARNLFAKRTA